MILEEIYTGPIKQEMGITVNGVKV